MFYYVTCGAEDKGDGCADGVEALECQQGAGEIGSGALRGVGSVRVWKRSGVYAAQSIKHSDLFRVRETFYTKT